MVCHISVKFLVSKKWAIFIPVSKWRILGCCQVGTSGGPYFQSCGSGPLHLFTLLTLMSKADESGWQWQIREDCVDQRNIFTSCITSWKTERGVHVYKYLLQIGKNTVSIRGFLLSLLIELFHEPSWISTLDLQVRRRGGLCMCMGVGQRTLGKEH